MVNGTRGKGFVLALNLSTVCVLLQARAAPLEHKMLSLPERGERLQWNHEAVRIEIVDLWEEIDDTTH